MELVVIICLFALLAAVSVALALVLKALVAAKAAKGDESMKIEFAELAARLLGEKEKTLAKTNEESVASLFRQLSEKLSRYEAEVEKASGENVKLGEHMKTQLVRLQNFADRAQAFTAALVGGNKIQGNWGEGMLSRLLEESGMKEGIHYDLQTGVKEGRPDASIYDALNRRIVLLDAKMNIKDYIAACNLPDDDAHKAERERLFRSHAAGVKRQIDNLASKRYPETVPPSKEGYSNLPVTVMYCPFNAVLEKALECDPALMQYAFERNIAIATPLTLWGFLGLVAYGWRQRAVEKRIDEIRDIGKDVVSALDSLLNDLATMGEMLGKATAAYESLNRRATEEKGQISVRRVAKKLVEYGVVPARLKQLSLVAAAAASLALSASANEVFQAMTPAGVKVRMLDFTEDDGYIPDRGNVPVRFLLQNTSSSKENLTFNLGFSHRWGRRADIVVSAETSVEPGEEKTFDVPVPYIGIPLHRSRLDGFRESGESIGPFASVADSKGETSLSYNYMGTFYCDRNRKFNANKYFVCISSNVSTNSLPRADRAVRYRVPDFAKFRRWQDMAPYDAFVIDSKDWDSLPELFRKIVPYYVAAGGRLVFVGDSSPFATMPYGLGTMQHLPGGIESEGRFMASLKAARSVFGPDDSSLSLACDIKARKMVDAFKRETPFGAIVLVLFAFAIVAGPVLIFSLAKANRRIWLLWLFPSIAILFTAAVSSVIFFANGINPVLKQVCYVLKDHAAGKTVSVRNDVVIASFPVGTPLSFDMAGSLLSYSSEGCGAGVSIEVDDGRYVFSKGWLPIKWPAVFRTITVGDIGEGAPAEDPPNPLSCPQSLRDVDVTTEERGMK